MELSVLMWVGRRLRMTHLMEGDANGNSGLAIVE